MVYEKVVLICLLVSLKCVFSEVCGNSTKTNCECQQYTDPQTHLPTSLADCSERQIENFPDNVEADLNILDLAVNNIQALDSTKHSISSGNLQELILSYNNITYIDANFFQSITNLKKLDLSNNFISHFDNADVFQNLGSLIRLDISYNNLNSLPDFIFNPLYKLTHLDLSYNYMEELLVQSNSVLTNQLGITPNLTHLHLNGLAIRNFSVGYFDSMTSIKRLSLADNQFTLIPTVPYSLEHLDLSRNKFTFISAKYLNYHSLKVLKLNGMPSLTDIHHYAFYNLFALERLVINDCPNLKEFSELAFDVPSKDVDHHIKELSLARNGLKRLNESYKYFFLKMEHVDLTHNPWVCDCDILWIQNFALEFYKPHEIKCNYPFELKHKRVLDLQHTDLKECFPAIYGKKSHRVVIVVLSVACVMLVGLIFYLLRYPINGIAKVHRMGPNSPYNLASTQEQN